MPRPASDRMEMDLAIMAGICTFHLQQNQPKKINFTALTFKKIKIKQKS